MLQICADPTAALVCLQWGAWMPCWILMYMPVAAQPEAGAGAEGQVARAHQPQRAALLPAVRRLLQQAGERGQERGHPAGLPLLWHAAMVLYW